jgi:hypothetical protein
MCIPSISVIVTVDVLAPMLAPEVTKVSITMNSSSDSTKSSGFTYIDTHISVPIAEPFE